MADCMMCWNEWPSTDNVPIQGFTDKVQVCRNCGRSIRQTKAFLRHYGFDMDDAVQASLLHANQSEAESGRDEPPRPPRSGSPKKT